MGLRAEKTSCKAPEHIQESTEKTKRRNNMGLDLRLRLFSLVEKLPENRLTAPLKKKVDTVQY